MFKQKKKKILDLIKTVGEGNWGEESDTEDPVCMENDGLETEFAPPPEGPLPSDFQEPGPSCPPDSRGREEADQPQQLPGPRPGPSIRPTSLADLPTDIRTPDIGDVDPTPTREI